MLSKQEALMYETALSEYKLTVTMADNALKAEAMYYIAEIQYRNEEYLVAKEGAFELINTMSDFQTWKAKSLILLARCYWKLEDVFNATYILDQMIQNFEDQKVVSEAKELKTLIEEDELRKKEEAAKDTIVELDLNEEGSSNDEIGE